MKWYVYAILSAILASLVAVLGKAGLSHIDSTLATTVRAIIMALVLVGIAVYFGKFSFIASLDNKALSFIAISGIAGALSWLFYFLAIQSGPVSGVVALDRTSLVFALMLSIFFLGESFSWQKVFGATLVTIGAILISL